MCLASFRQVLVEIRLDRAAVKLGSGIPDSGSQPDTRRWSAREGNISNTTRWRLRTSHSAASLRNWSTSLTLPHFAHTSTQNSYQCKKQRKQLTTTEAEKVGKRKKTSASSNQSKFKYESSGNFELKTNYRPILFQGPHQIGKLNRNNVPMCNHGMPSRSFAVRPNFRANNFRIIFAGEDWTSSNCPIFSWFRISGESEVFFQTFLCHLR